MKWKISFIVFMVLLFSLACHKIIAKEKYTSEGMVGKWMKADFRKLGVIAPDGKIKLVFPMSKKSFAHFYGARPVGFGVRPVPYVKMASWEDFANASKASTEDLMEIIANLNARVDELEGRIAELEKKRR